MNITSQQIEAWCSSVAWLGFVDGDPQRVMLTLRGADSVEATVAQDGVFLTLTANIPLQPETAALLVDQEVSAGVTQLLEAVLAARSSLAEAKIDARSTAVTTVVRVHEEGLNGHTFLSAASDLGKLLETIETGISAVAAAVPALQEAEREAERTREEIEHEQAEAVAAAAAETAQLAEDRERFEAEAEQASQALLGVESSACTNCGAALGPDAKFCVSCGTPVAEASSTCKSCGAALADGAQFCINCGTRVL